MTTPNSTLQDTLAPLAAQLVDIADKIALLQLEEAALKSKIRESVPGPDQYMAGGLTVVVSTNRRFNPVLAATVIPADLLPIVSVTTSVVDKKKVEVLCPDQYDACFVNYDLKITLK